MKFDFKKAKRAQELLRVKINLKPLKKVELVAGCDLTYLDPFKTPTVGIGAFVVLSFPSLEVVEYAHECLEVKIPYVPCFLSFREIPLLSKTFRKLRNKPDLVVVDGHGIIHPRRLGIATHFGIVENVPAIGCAKKPLYGVFKKPCEKRGCYEPIFDSKNGNVLGYILRTKDRVKPVYISPGNLVTLENTLSIMKQLMGKYRIPEPTRLAHNYLQGVRKQLLNKP